MSEIAILEAFTDLPDPRRTAGQRHEKALCIALPWVNLNLGLSL